MAVLPYYLLAPGGASAAALEEEFQMAFPWIFEENFETGTLGGFTSETDTLGRLDFPGMQDGLEIPPALGGYCMRVDLNRGVTTTIPDAFVLQSTAMSIATGVTQYARLMLYLSDDVKVPGAGNSVRFFQLISAGGEEASIGLVRGDKGEQLIGVFNPEYGGRIGGIEVQRNMWLPIEISAQAHTLTAELRVHCMGSQIAAIGMPWPTLTGLRLGAISQSLDIRGKLYFDSLIVDDERLVASQPLNQRELDNETITLTKTGYVFPGPGEVDCATLTPTQANTTLLLYDTDRLPVAHHDLKMTVKCAAIETRETKGRKIFTRGCYAVLLVGTAPATDASATIQLGRVTEYAWGGFGEEGRAA